LYGLKSSLQLRQAAIFLEHRLERKFGFSTILSKFESKQHQDKMENLSLVTTKQIQKHSLSLS
jgi:hypothetical protein